ncbi:hypothetical protein N9L68_09285 [bacterium]|nr:hypothetical protein [bacterium]
MAVCCRVYFVRTRDVLALRPCVLALPVCAAGTRPRIAQGAERAGTLSEGGSSAAPPSAPSIGKCWRVIVIIYYLIASRARPGVERKCDRKHGVASGRGEERTYQTSYIIYKREEGRGERGYIISNIYIYMRE